MLKLRALVVFSFVLAALQIRTSSADTVYSDFTTGNPTYNLSAGWNLSGSSNPISFEDAMSFTPTADYSFVAADLAVSLISGTNSLTVTINADVSNLPGTVLDTLTLTSSMGPFGSNNPLLVADPETPLTLHSGVTYWLVVSATDSTYASWNDNNSPSDIYDGWQNRNGAGWVELTGSANPTAAFSIIGTEVKAVPEPASIALFGTGMLSVIGLHLMRKRQAAKRSA
jgi:hypothetical protein